jgi:hydroxysqualene dehydroxylase
MAEDSRRRPRSGRSDTVTRRVVVVGAGLAGLSAALRLADASCAVTVLESRSRLGGLTHSFRRGELDIDNGQHVFLRCCTNYRAFLDRLGVTGDTALQPRLDVPVVRAGDGRRARLRRDRLPAPLHLARSLATYGVLSPQERLRAVGAALALRRLDPAGAGVDRVGFGDWLARHGQSDVAVDALWDLIGVATLNARAADASLALAATVFQVGLLERADAADIGWARVPLQRLHGYAAGRALDAAGADVRVRVKVSELAPVGSEWLIRTSDGDVVADAVVVATDPVTAERLLPAGALDLRPAWSQRLGASPIVNLHVVLDRVVMPEPFLAVVGSPVQWVFDRTVASGLAAGQYLALSLSAADHLVDRSVAELRAMFLPALVRVLPRLAHATVVDFFATRESQATFRPAPGSAADRPGPATRMAGLALAGAYTATGWPATMEGAVRSGEAAANEVMTARRDAERVATA